jgi:Putative zinc-finger
VTRCDDVRPLLADVVLGSPSSTDDVAIRRHLRGCAGCRHELDALREGLGVFESTLERPAPPELRDRVLGVLAEEWAETRAGARDRDPVPTRWRVAVAAALVAALAAGTFGLVQYGRTRDLLPDARGYRAVLATLGGTGFKVGTLEPARPGQPVEGSVVAYEASHDQSFVVVFVRTPKLEGRGTIKVSRSDGTTWDPGPIEFDGDGDAAVWWVTDRSINSMTGLTITAPDGSTLATAGLRVA